jgi:hypothetical protein
LHGGKGISTGGAIVIGVGGTISVVGLSAIVVTLWRRRRKRKRHVTEPSHSIEHLNLTPELQDTQVQAPVAEMVTPNNPPRGQNVTIRAPYSDQKFELGGAHGSE